MRRVKSPLSGEPNAIVGRYLLWVRTVGFVLVVSLVMAVMVPAPARASTAELVQQLDGLVSSFPGGAGIWIGDPTVAIPLFTHDPDEQVIAASLYKLGVLAEAERRVDAGELHYNDVITIQPDDITSDGSFEDAGAQLTLDEALEAMITISDNGSALALWHMLGGANIDVKVRHGNVEVQADLTGVPPGTHGFHIHEKGDCGNNGANAGGHFNPTSMRFEGRVSSDKVSQLKVGQPVSFFQVLVVGIAGTGDIRQVGRIGFKALLYFEIVTTLGPVIGTHGGPGTLGLFWYYDP